MRARTFAAWAGAAVVAAAAAVGRFSGAAAGGADSSGYLNSARLLARGRLLENVRAIPGLPAAAYPPAVFVPLGMRPGPVPGTAVPTYPVGLPLHLAAASLLVGLAGAPAAVNALAWIAAVVLQYRLARLLGLSRGWGAAAAGLFAVFPVTVLQSVRVMSDLLATAWCLAAVVFALRGGARRGYAAAAGASLAVAVLVRPTDALVAPAVALALGANPATLCFAAAGAAPVAAGLGLYNVAVYGHALATGYTGELALVSLGNAGRGALHLGRWLAEFLGAPALLLVAAGLARAVRGDRRQVVLLVWAAAVVGFYSLYQPSLAGWWRLRFLLPALPALILSALLAARDLLTWARDRWPSRPAPRRAVAAALAACLLWSIAASGYWVVTRRVWQEGASEEAYPRCVAWAEQRIPPGAVLLAMQTSGAVYFYGRSPIVRYDLLDDGSYARLVGDARAAGVGLYALLFRNDRLEFERRWPGAWQRLDGLGEASLWRLADAAPSARAP